MKKTIICLIIGIFVFVGTAFSFGWSKLGSFAFGSLTGSYQTFTVTPISNYEDGGIYVINTLDESIVLRDDYNNEEMTLPAFVGGSFPVTKDGRSGFTNTVSIKHAGVAPTAGEISIYQIR